MLKSIEWQGDVVRVGFHDGSHKDFTADDAIDLYGWLQQQYDRVLDILRRQIAEDRKREKAL